MVSLEESQATLENASTSTSTAAADADKSLDVVFVQDTTGSQGPYILASKKAIKKICNKISFSTNLPKHLIRFGLIAFRDHPPQDRTYVTKSFGFTSDVQVMEKNLASLVASGGGDGPEAQTAALAEALDQEWGDNAIKMVILITDSPPHGVGENDDGFSKSPDQNDPLDIARQMAEHGITLFVIACEPSISQTYQYAADFYTALVEITSGKMLPLTMADKLGDHIAGTAVETIETEKLISEFEQVIVDDVFEKDIQIEAVTEKLQKALQSRGETLKTWEIENGYVETTQSKENVRIWMTAKDIGEVVKKIQPTQKAGSSWHLHRGSGFTSASPSPGIYGVGFSSQMIEPPMASATLPRAGPSISNSSILAVKSSLTNSVVPNPSFTGNVDIKASLVAKSPSMIQAQRIVQQSVSRQSKVGATHYISKSTGKAVSILSLSPPSFGVSPPKE